MIDSVGTSAGQGINAAISGDTNGVFNAASNASTFIPDAGNKVSVGLQATGSVVNNAVKGNTVGIVSDVGGALSNIVDGQAGSIINQLNPTATNVTDNIVK